MTAARSRDDSAGLARTANGVEVRRPMADPLPEVPNHDMGNLARPPASVDEPRISDDNDLNAEGGEFSNTPLRRPYEQMSRRGELARQQGAPAISG